jgi:Flp pilus assembly protein TadD
MDPLSAAFPSPLATHRPMPPSLCNVTRRLAALTLLAMAVIGPAFAQVADIEALAAAGQQAEALERVQRLLVERPRDPQLRFLNGVLLVETGRPDDAADVFARLANDYPEIPEPHNNLAVLYAARGEYDKARAALDAALRANPDYAVAHLNLGDLHAQLARRSYERALQLDPTNAAVPPKLELLRRIVEPPPAPTPP